MTTFTMQMGRKIVGRNPESADMVNPMGHIYQDCPFVEACTKHGQVFVYTGKVFHDNHANLLVELFSRMKSLDVTNHHEWSYVRDSYGSNAFVENYFENNIRMMDREELDYHHQMGTFIIG